MRSLFLLVSFVVPLGHGFFGIFNFQKEEKPVDYMELMKEYDGNVDHNDMNLAVLAGNRTWKENRDTTYAKLFYHVYKQKDSVKAPYDRDVYLNSMRTLRKIAPFLREVELDGTDLYDVTGLQEFEILRAIRQNYTDILREVYTIVYAAQTAGYIVHKARGSFFFKTNDCTSFNSTRLCRDHVGILAQALGGLNASISQNGAIIRHKVYNVPFEYETSYIYNLV
ncbi:unnamed protein product [Bursaphelenchus xylophilus]|uniref:(pine wood nematode) hypothetical protein n=1 Tax=Bursaphelenchus xylophilus TaxID=6326 RepID=A0A1I7RVC2_BURXY|nr:unnamed protein product [Bursaphelenchus xylophilus]CAG9086665.1 unnamed protein product [Bursaphelenchus xylophilus]